MKTVSTPISDIRPNPDNPRTISDAKMEKLVASIREFPEMLEMRPIVVSADMMILGGNMRLEACRQAGLKKVPVIKASDLTPDQQREFIIKDNVGFGAWDWGTLAEDWDTNELSDWGLDIPDSILAKGESEDDEYDVPEDIETGIVCGDVITIGPHRLVCGDARLQEDCQKLFGDHMADLVITDPPYNVDYTGKTKDALKIDNDKMSDEDFFQFLYDFFVSIMCYTKGGGIWYVWHADSEGYNFRRAMTEAGLTIRQCLVWVKDAFVMGRQDYQWQHEPCLYGWKEGAAHSWYGDRRQTTLLEFDRPKRSESHPTMKPVPLIGHQMRNSSKVGDIIADPFLGSGTTMVAAHQMGRICNGMEIDPQYCAVVIDRMRTLDPEIPVLINGNPIGTE